MKKASPTPRAGSDLLAIFRRLYKHFGPLRWWPAETPFEIMVGAILTQNTAWTNVEKAIAGLKGAGLLEPEALLAADPDLVRRLIRPSGYYNQKTERILDFARFLLDKPGRGSIAALAREDTAALRRRLLALRGIGPETADSILLYALGHPVFVIDAYTRRIFSRLGLISPAAGYGEIQEYFTRRLPADRKLYNEFHAQIVYLGKDYCRRRPRCEACPLSPLGSCRIEPRGEAARARGARRGPASRSRKKG